MRKLLLLLPFVCLFMACQKETSFEIAAGTGTTAAGTSSGTASYKLIGAGSSCTGAVVSGTYQAGTALVANDTVQLQISVDTIGTYILSTNTTNGMVFSASGTFAKTGSQTITLTGTGTPVGAGSYTFTPPVGVGCAFVVPVIAGTTVSTSSAVFTLKDSSGACTGATLKGTYTVGTALNGGNTVLLNVSVTTIGNYTLSAPTVNGMTFSTTGTFTTTGAQTITLVGAGTPTAIATSTIKPVISASTCTFNVPVVAAAPPATYTVGGAGGACSGSSVSGSYNVSTPLTSTNTVSIQVNVTVAGSYSITTGTVNGMTFSGSGVFTATGMQSITLYGSGTPTTAGTSNFSTNGTSGCSFDVTIVGAATDFINCKLNGVYATFNYNPYATAAPSPATGLIISGDVSLTSNVGISFAKYSLSGINVVSGQYIDAAVGIWVGGTGYSGTSITFNISSQTATRAVGTFSGTMKDNNGQGSNIKTITEGKFDVPVQ